MASQLKWGGLRFGVTVPGRCEAGMVTRETDSSLVRRLALFLLVADGAAGP